MQVYAELALAENFCMDFTLLFAAKSAVKNTASAKRLALASALGAVFAVVFPLFSLNAVWAVIVKILSGLLICLVAGRFKSIKAYVKFAAAFLIFTALLGGALIGIFSLTGLDYSAGQGFILSKIPIGIPLFGALLLILGAKKLAARLKKTCANSVNCRIYAGQSQIDIKGFFDSGNKVYLKGLPVSVIPQEAAKKLLDVSGIKEGVKIHTVAGSKTIGVFTADKIEIDFGEKRETLYKVKIGVNPNRADRAILHCDLLEDIKTA